MKGFASCEEVGGFGRRLDFCGGMEDDAGHATNARGKGQVFLLRQNGRRFGRLK